MWTKHKKRLSYDMLGFIPYIIDENDPRPVAEQIDDRYAHGGGWKPFGESEWKMSGDRSKIYYPGDPPLSLLFSTRIRDEQVLVYDCAMVAVVQKDGRFAVTRMD